MSGSSTATPRRSTDADLDWADMVMTGGMLPQQPDTLEVIDAAPGARQARGRRRARRHARRPHVYRTRRFPVLGEAEEIIDAFVGAWQSGRRGTASSKRRDVTTDVTRTPMPRFDLLKLRPVSSSSACSSRAAARSTASSATSSSSTAACRAPRPPAQMLAELDALYRTRLSRPRRLRRRQLHRQQEGGEDLPAGSASPGRRRDGYPFEFSTEASINLADDDALLAADARGQLLRRLRRHREPGYRDARRRSRRSRTRAAPRCESIGKIYRAGMFVNAGFIVGFDSEKGSVAEAMIDCIEATAIPVCMVGLLYALPNTQLTRRLAAEGRLFPARIMKAKPIRASAIIARPGSISRRRGRAATFWRTTRRCCARSMRRPPISAGSRKWLWRSTARP